MTTFERVRVQLAASRDRGRTFDDAWRSALAGVRGGDLLALRWCEPTWRASYLREDVPRSRPRPSLRNNVQEFRAITERLPPSPRASTWDDDRWRQAELAYEARLRYGVTKERYARLVSRAQGTIANYAAVWHLFGDQPPETRPSFAEALVAVRAGMRVVPHSLPPSPRDGRRAVSDLAA